MLCVEREVQRWRRRLCLPPIKVRLGRWWNLCSWSRQTDAGYEILIAPGMADRATILHKLGHVVLDEHLGGVISRREFRKLFGDVRDRYSGLWYFLPWSLAGRLYEERPDLPSAYAGVHPEECWAETFSLALRSRRRSFGNRRMNQRAAFARRVVKALSKRARLFLGIGEVLARVVSGRAMQLLQGALGQEMPEPCPRRSLTARGPG